MLGVGFAVNNTYDEGPDPIEVNGGDVTGVDITLQEYEQLLVHNIDTDEWFMEIQTAIDDPDTLDGHTLECHTATFYEEVDVYKEVTLIAASTPVIDASGGTGINITANNVTIDGFEIFNCSYGIECYDLGFNIQNNIIDSTNDGIYLYIVDMGYVWK